MNIAQPLIVGTLVLAAIALVVDQAIRHRRVLAASQRLARLSAKPVGELAKPQAESSSRVPFTNFIDAELVRAGAEKYRDFVLPYVVGAFVVSCVLAVLVEDWIGVVVFACGLIGPWFILKWFQRYRLQAFVGRLPMFLERVRQLVMIGNPIQFAFTKATRDADPICKEYLENITRRVEYGAPFPETLAEFSSKLRIQDVYMLSACVKANARYGGRISNNLANLISQLNNKKRLDREIRAATAETRTSVSILLTLTMALIAFIMVQNPNTVHFFLTDKTGHLLLGLLIGLPSAGLLVMYRILKIDL